ncbi:MAG TPA: RNA 2',3'-cyclic phosphodiesterase [Anaerolineales bacterium]|nr:RNA 2',3'-cyclic phosphodiesterase [Anaerolineales bacterium]
MAVIRAFIALDLSAEISQSLDQISRELMQRMPQRAIRWVPAKNIHLTLKFLGDVSPSSLESLQKMIQVESENYPPFDISIGGVGAFLSTRRPRVVWVGVTAPELLSALQHSIESAASRLGYPLEDRPFSPHLTLGRVNRSASPVDLQHVGQVLNGYNIGSLGSVHISGVHLYRSDLSPEGAHYTRLFSAPLKKAPVT